MRRFLTGTKKVYLNSKIDVLANGSKAIEFINPDLYKE